MRIVELVIIMMIVDPMMTLIMMTMMRPHSAGHAADVDDAALVPAEERQELPGEEQQPEHVHLERRPHLTTFTGITLLAIGAHDLRQQGGASSSALPGI
jgi:hypothetical protein